jgi:transposase
MKQIAMIGIDLAKNVFQLHAVDASHKPVLRRQLQRAQMLPFFAKLPPRLVVMEACGSAHYWAREIGALGHEVRLVPPAGLCTAFGQARQVRQHRCLGGLRSRQPAIHALCAGEGP